MKRATATPKSPKKKPKISSSATTTTISASGSHPMVDDEDAEDGEKKQSRASVAQVGVHPSLLGVFGTPNVRDLILRFLTDTADILTLRQVHPQLRKAPLFLSQSSINLAHMVDIAPSWFDKHLGHYNKITRLNIDSCERLAATILTSAIPWRKLEELSISSLRMLDSQFFAKLFPHLESLRRLNVSNTQVTFEKLQKLPHPLKLQLLHVYKCNIGDTEMENLIKLFPHLTSLAIGGLQDFEADTVKRLSQLTNLEDLSLSHLTKVNDLSALAIGLKQLRKLTLYHCPLRDSVVQQLYNFASLEWVCIWGAKLSDETTLPKLVQKCYRLQYMKIVDCKNLSSRIRKQILDARPALQLDMLL